MKLPLSFFYIHFHVPILWFLLFRHSSSFFFFLHTALLRYDLHALKFILQFSDQNTYIVVQCRHNLTLEHFHWPRINRGPTSSLTCSFFLPESHTQGLMFTFSRGFLRFLPPLFFQY